MPVKKYFIKVKTPKGKFISNGILSNKKNKNVKMKSVSPTGRKRVFKTEHVPYKNKTKVKKRKVTIRPKKITIKKRKTIKKY